MVRVHGDWAGTPILYVAYLPKPGHEQLSDGIPRSAAVSSDSAVGDIS